MKLPQGKKGLFLESDKITKNGLTYDTFYWSGTRAFMHSDAVLLNSPWTDITIIPLKAVPDSDLMTNYSNRIMTDQPDLLASLLIANPALKQKVLERTDFFYYIDPYNARPAPMEDVRRFLAEESEKWNCQAGTIYALCQKAASATGLARPDSAVMFSKAGTE